jgi:hypothetical protein
MKEHFLSISLSIFIVLAFSFFIYNSSSDSMTGFIIEDYVSNNFANASFNQSSSITLDDALLALASSEKIILHMQNENFSIVFVNDTLIQAKKVLEQAIYAEILRNSSYSQENKTMAKNALKLVDWQNVTFNRVLIYTDLIVQRQKQAYSIQDSITLLEKKAKQYSSQDINISAGLALFDQAKQSFMEDRYDEAQNLILQADKSFEDSRAKAATFNTLIYGTKNFFQKYWPYVLMFLIFISAAVYFTYGRIMARIILKRIEKMKLEFKTITELMKQSQRDRFQSNKISGLVYNIRMAKYKSRQEEIKELLPILQEKLIRYRKS